MLITLGLDPADVISNVLTAAQAAARLGVDALEFIRKQLSLSAIAERLGVDLGILGDISDIGEDIVSFLSGGAISLTTAILELLEEAGLDALSALNTLLFTAMDIVRFAGLDPAVALVQAGVTVAELFGANVPDTIAFSAAPIRPERAAELAEKLVNEGYGIVALNEVFEPAIVNLLALEMAGRGVAPDLEEGPSAVGDVNDQEEKRFLGSGLLTMGLNVRLRRDTPVQARRRIYKVRGDDMVDADAWSNKGVLLTVVDVGLGQLDVYSTHLFSGGELIPRQTLRDITNFFNPGVPLPEIDEERVKIDARLGQMEELVEFFNETHDPTHVAIICGDLNLRGDDPDLMYLPLLDVVSRTRTRDGTPTVMEDVWAAQGGGKIGSDLHGNTHNDHHDQGPVCRRRDLSALEVTTRFGSSPADPNLYYCDEDQPPPNPGAGAGRIDYVFLERPLRSHAFTLDISRMRRRPFERTSPSAEARFLSDHIGLDLNLLVSLGP